MTSTMMANGKLRKSLAEEIDRLHSILDGLSEALNEAVATAVKEAVASAVKEAVQQTLQAVIAEVLRNAELLQTVRGLVAPQLQPEPSQTQGNFATMKRWFQPLFAKAAVWVTGCYGRVGQLGTAVIGKMGQWAAKLKGQVVGAFQKLRSCWHTCRDFRVPVLTALAVGVGAGGLAYFGGPYVAAFMGWLAGFTTTLSVQAGIWV